MSTLSFFGAAGIVTGSCSLLETGTASVLIDCGLFQGNRSIQKLNDSPFPFDAAGVDLMILTHAHTDHAGLIPKLVASGFSGSIHATAATIDLLEFMLPDSARIQEAETERDNRRREHRGQPIQSPAFTMRHVETALTLMRPVDYNAWIEPFPDLFARFWNAGHILGSASIELKYKDTKNDRTMRLLFSGDLGPDQKTFHEQPEAEQGYDYVICESTYGNRERADYTLDGRRTALRRELTEGLRRGGNVIIPSFAVERSQELLHDIGVLLARNEIPATEVFLDSPLASKVTKVFSNYASALKDVDIPEEQLFRDPRLHIVESVDESIAVNRITGGAVIISASGMAEAGRIIHHLKNNIWRKEATVLFVGYQAPGTTGSKIQSGVDAVFLHGKKYKIRATVRSIGNYSAHADQSELLSWILERRPIAGALFLNHGGDAAREKLKTLLKKNGLSESDIILPALDESFELTAGSPQSKGRRAERITPDDLSEDWNEAFETLILDLERALDAVPDKESRERIIANMRIALSAETINKV